MLCYSIPFAMDKKQKWICFRLCFWSVGWFSFPFINLCTSHGFVCFCFFYTYFVCCAFFWWALFVFIVDRLFFPWFILFCVIICLHQIHWVLLCARHHKLKWKMQNYYVLQNCHHIKTNFYAIASEKRNIIKKFVCFFIHSLLVGKTPFRLWFFFVSLFCWLKIYNAFFCYHFLIRLILITSLVERQ